MSSKSATWHNCSLLPNPPGIAFSRQLLSYTELSPYVRKIKSNTNLVWHLLQESFIVKIWQLRDRSCFWPNGFPPSSGKFLCWETFAPQSLFFLYIELTPCKKPSKVLNEKDKMYSANFLLCPSSVEGRQVHRDSCLSTVLPDLGHKVPPSQTWFTLLCCGKAAGAIAAAGVAEL